ncbi:uncharacterized protein YukE [Embleya sp. AB8]
MVHADGAPSGGPGGGGTDFEGFTLEQLQAMIAQASPDALGRYAEKLHGTAQRIQTATLGLSQCIQALSGVWEGPSAESFRTWAGGVTAAATGLGDYVSAAGTHINHVGQQIFVAKVRMPHVDATVLATANQGPVAVVSKAATNQATGGNPGGVDPIKAHQDAKAQVDAAHREAVTQMRTLASTYRVAAADLKGLPAPVFPAPPIVDDRERLTTLDMSGGGGSGGSGSAGGAGSPHGRSGAGGSGSSGIYTAPQGVAPNARSTTASSGQSGPHSLPGNSPDITQHVPQSTALQGGGPLTAPDSKIDNPWMPQVSGNGPTPPGSPGSGPPNGGVPVGVPPYSGSGPLTSTGGGASRTGSIPGSGPRGSGPGGLPPRSGGMPGAPSGSGGSPGPLPRSGAPGVGGTRGSFSARPEIPGSIPGQTDTASTGTPGRSAGMPGAAGAGATPQGAGRSTTGRRLATAQGGSVGNVAGNPSRRNSPRLRALPVEGEAADTGVDDSARSTRPGQRTPFTGGTRSEQVRRRTTRAEDEDDNTWDGPRRPGVVPPVID